MKSILLFAGALALVPASVALLAYFSPDQPANAAAVRATYANGALYVSIPHSGGRAGAGNLTVQVLDPEDKIVGQVNQRVYSSDKQVVWTEDLSLPKTLTLEDIVWHRLRYQFTYDNATTHAEQATRSISQILRRPVVHVIGQKSYLAGSQAAVRLVATDSSNDTIPGPASVEIQLLDTNRKSRILFTGKLNQRGTIQAQFRFPAGLVGSYSLRYAVDTPIGPAEYSQAIQLDDQISILLTTEKPIYQPSQTIHVRALALDRSNHQAAAARNLTFELEDSRGNKVFRKVTQTDSFGIASAEFVLADEVNLGAYHLRALMDEAGATRRNTAEIALQVDRYMLPKFKVAVDLAAQDGDAKHGYRPGDHVRGTVRSNYFFGKPVDGVPVTVKASAVDVSVFDAGVSQGKTDADGAFHFDIHLPSYLAGRPLNQGAARILIEATVKDGAGHSESRGEPITVSESPLLITAVPESGQLTPGLDNQVFILTSYPDGTPAQAELRVRAPGNADQTASTDKGGVAIVRLRSGAGGTALQIDAQDHEGNHASSSVPLQSRTGSDQILLHSEHAVYGTGERMQLQVYSTKQRGSAYVDVIKDGQTVATRDLDIVNGRAELALIATPNLAGTVEINAYLFGKDARPVADHRLVFVQPADELKVETTLDSPVYKPGGEARIGFHVTNARGEGVQAALGLQVVDQAVFALAEKQPGFAKVFFYLEQEAMKPRYEIHSLGLPEAIAPTEPAEFNQRDRAARALFSATDLVGANNSQLEFGRTVPQQKYSEYAARYLQQFGAQIWKLTRVLSSESETPSEACDAASIQRRFEEVPIANRLDAWGNQFRIENAGWNRGMRFLAVHSAGPDGQFNTSDDLVERLEDPNCVLPGSGKIDLQYEHDRGPFNGLAEIAGRVSDPNGANVSRATINVRGIDARTEHTLTAGPDGRFSLAGVRPGRYNIQVSSAGFLTVAREVALQPRDRAVLSVMLNVGAMMQAVEVSAAAAILPSPLPFEGRATLGALNSPPVMRAVAMDARTGVVKPSQPSAQEPRVRSWFPEALYVTPEIITDQQGHASVTIPIADNITTWRMAMLASTSHGALGSGTSSLKVFQDFFTDLDLPVTLTQGDQVSIPVAVYNYSGSRGNVHLQLQKGDWFSANDPLDKTLAVDSGRVGASQFTIEAKRIGKFKLTLKSQMDDASKRADIVVRDIEVVPNGREQTMAFNGRLDSTVSHQLDFPAASVPDASTIFVRLYPGPLSQVIEGMDSVLRMPFGCFEQTSSATYPNVLALDYMKRTKKATPEVHAKAEGFIATGYQRLLTFEVPGGGFSWFGNAPANKILTSYGLMEFGDMSKVYGIDPKVIERTQQWLAGQQQPDGSWKPDSNFINEGATNRYNADVLRITAYIAWSLENTGYQEPAVEKAKQFVEAHLNTENRARPDAYTLAVLANFAADFPKDRSFTNRSLQMLIDARTEQDDKAWWKTEETSVYSTGPSAIVETTGLAVQALLKWGGNPAVAAKAINYIVAGKNAAGTWGTTQATVMALRALLVSTEKGGATAKGAVEVVLNGKTAASLTLTAENNDLLHQLVLKGTAAQSANLVEIRFSGEGSLAYQVAGRYFLPWNQRPANEPLSITVSYDRTHLAQDDIAAATATVRNNLAKTANMVMVDLGIPPGFELLTEDLQTYREKSANSKSGRLEKFNLTATQAILYFDSIAPRDEFALTFRLRAKYPIRARTFASRVYEYYSPEISSLAAPVQFEVRKR